MPNQRGFLRQGGPEVKYVMSYLVLGSLFIGSAASALLFDVHDPALIREAAFVFLIGVALGIVHRKKFQTPADFLFYVASMLMITTAFVSGITFLGVTPVPRLRLYLKTFYLFSFILFQIAVWRGGSRGLLFLIVVLLSSNIFLSWYYLGVTLRSLPLALYVISSWFYLFQSWGRKIRLDSVDLAMLAVLVASFVSTLLSWDRANAVFGFVHLALGVPLFLVARHCVQDADIPRYLRYFVLVFSVTTLFLIIFGFVLVHEGKSAFSNEIAGYNVNRTAGYITLAFPIGVWAIVVSDNYRNRLLLTVVVFLSLALLFLTRSRSAMLACAIVSVAGVGAAFLKRSLRLTFQTAGAVLVALLLAAAFVIYADPVRNIVTEVMSTQTMTIRLAVWKLFIANFWHHSPAFGFGPENFLVNAALEPAVQDPVFFQYIKAFIHAFGPNLHAHNLMVQLLWDFGIVGFVSILVMGIVSVRAHLKDVMKSGISWESWKPYAAGAILGLFVQEIFDYTLTDPVTYYGAMLLLGFVLRPEKTEQPVERAGIVARQRVFLAGSVFLFAILFWVGWNRVIYVRQATTFRGAYRADWFVNVTFPPESDLSDERIRAFEKQKKYSLPNITDHRPEQMAGELYFQAHKRRGLEGGLTLAESQFRKCLAIYPHSAFCAHRLGQILKTSGRTEEATQWNARALALDPYGLLSEP